MTVVAQVVPADGMHSEDMSSPAKKKRSAKDTKLAEKCQRLGKEMLILSERMKHKKDLVRTTCLFESKNLHLSKIAVTNLRLTALEAELNELRKKFDDLSS